MNGIIWAGETRVSQRSGYAAGDYYRSLAVRFAHHLPPEVVAEVVAEVVSAMEEAYR